MLSKNSILLGWKSSISKKLKVIKFDLDFKQCVVDGYNNVGCIFIFTEHYDEEIHDFITKKLFILMKLISEIIKLYEWSI